MLPLIFILPLSHCLGWNSLEAEVRFRVIYPYWLKRKSKIFRTRAKWKCESGFFTMQCQERNFYTKPTSIALRVNFQAHALSLYCNRNIIFPLIFQIPRRNMSRTKERSYKEAPKPPSVSDNRREELPYRVTVWRSIEPARLGYYYLR